MSADRRPIRRALVSVSDKTDLEVLGQGLAAAGVEIVSTGSTASFLREAGVAVTAVEAVTGFPECLDGRVKTLHPQVHAALLADRRRLEHERQLAALGIAPFDLLVVNLYPFRETVASGVGAEECVESIDVGGPAMVRAAAKNCATVAVVVEPRRYGEVLAALAAGGFTDEERRTLAAAAFAHTAAYDVAVASWFATLAPDPTGFPHFLGATWSRADVLRYGENPHQRAALYASPDGPRGLAHAEQLHGRPMSYNNYVDADAARRAAYDFDEPCVAIVKHTNPCGLAIATNGGDPIAAAHRKAHACDPLSAYGGVVAANRAVTRAMAEQVAEVFTEVVVAPEFAADAVEVLTRKPSVRLLRCAAPSPSPDGEWRAVSGGLLVQTRDRVDAPGDDPASWRLVAGAAADGATLADLAFAWRAVRAVKSNAILLAAGGATVGVGMGQVNRVDAARLAVARAGERAVGSVAASDAFFPFADGVALLLDGGVRAIVQPGGSIRDEEVIAAARERGATLYTTGVRHFSH